MTIEYKCLTELFL